MKKQIHEMLDSIQERETMNLMDGSELLVGELTPEEKERILKLALSRIKKEREEQNQLPLGIKTGKNKRWKILAAAVAAVLVFASTAVAAEVFQWDHRISAYLEINQDNSALLEGSGMNPNVQIEQNGVTIKAIQTLGDANNIYVLFEVTVPEGITLGPNSRFDGLIVEFSGKEEPTGMGYSCDFLDDGSDEDNKGTMLLSLHANKDINRKVIKVRFGDLLHYEPAQGDYVIDVPGNWELKWQLNYQDNSLQYHVNQDLIIHGETVKVNRVDISPIAVNVHISGNYFKKFDLIPPDFKGDLIRISAITLKDGTVLTPEDAFGWGSSIHGNKYVLNMQMKKLLDVKKVQSITLNETQILLAGK